MITDFVNWHCTSCTSCTTLHTFSLRFFCFCSSYRICVVSIGSQLCWSGDFLAAWLCIFLVITVFWKIKYDNDDDEMLKNESIYYMASRIDWFGLNGTYSTNRLYRAFEKYVSVKKWASQHWYVLGIHTINHYNK